MQKKDDNQISLVEELYQNQPFMHWVKNLNNNHYLLASIPMVRNLFEYSGDKDGNYKKLTNFLHYKEGTSELKIEELKNIYHYKLKSENVDKIENVDANYFENLKNCCNKIIKKKSYFNLEVKIILSIAIRLLAEKFMIKKIGNPVEITSNQTRELFDQYVRQFPDEKNIQLLERVNLMTPENIHLNSFMYEPILDMEDRELRELYEDINNVQTN